MRHVVFVVPYLFETSVRFLRGALALPDLALSLVSSEPLERFDADVARAVAGHWRVGDCLDPAQLTQAVEGLARQRGPVDRLVGVLEQLQVPLAQVREALAIPGMDAATARNFRDKGRMKDVLAAAGLPCARHRAVQSSAEALDFARALGGPLVVKPPEGAGAVGTYRVDDAAQLEQALAAAPPSPGRPLLLEELVVGEEHSFDAVMLDGQLLWSSISVYRPTPLEVLRHDWIQWCVLLPREIDGPRYEAIHRVGPAALRALGLRTGLAHMEWFRRPDGSVAVSEVGARPPGAQFTSLMGWAHGVDMHKAWSRLVLQDAFDPPARRWAVGAAYLRGQGRGRVRAVHGLEQAQHELGGLVVEVRLPRPGQSPSSSYEGDGYAILRHPETAVVARGLMRLVELVKVELG